MKKIGIFASLVVAVSLSACAPPVVGTVVEKDYDKGFWQPYSRSERYACGTETYPTTKTVNGKTTSSTGTRTKYCNRQIQDRRWIADDWDVSVRDEAGVVREVNVNQAQYNSIKVGDHFDNTKK